MMSSRVPAPPLYLVRPHEIEVADLKAIKGRALCLAPHPDDEALGCGGLLAACAHVGLTTEVVFLTAGSLTSDGMGGDKPSQTGQRALSAAEATRRLGISRHRILSGLSGQVTQFNQGLVVELATTLKEDMPSIIMLPHPWERHVDHRGTSACLGMALSKFYHRPESLPRILFYEVWTPLAHCNLILDISAHLEAKEQAIECYASNVVGFLQSAILGLNRFRAVSNLNRDCHAEVFQEIDFDSFMNLAAGIKF